MGRVTEDDSLRYFYHRSLSSTIFLLILGFAFFSVGYGKNKNVVFFLIGGIFLVLAIWWVVRNRRAVPGERIDALAQDMARRANIRKEALEYLRLSTEQCDETDTWTLDGYCAEPIDTQPLLRLDYSDGRARSSNYQMSFILVGVSRLCTFSIVRSLVDEEEFKGGEETPFDEIADLRLQTLQRLCESTGKGSAKQVADFHYLELVRKDGSRFLFSVGRDQIAACGELVEKVLTQMKIERSGHEEEQAPIEKREGEYVRSGGGTSDKVGLIGQELHDLKRR